MCLWAQGRKTRCYYVDWPPPSDLPSWMSTVAITASQGCKICGTDLDRLTCFRAILNGDCGWRGFVVFFNDPCDGLYSREKVGHLGSRQVWESLRRSQRRYQHISRWSRKMILPNMSCTYNSTLQLGYTMHGWSLQHCTCNSNNGPYDLIIFKNIFESK